MQNKQFSIKEKCSDFGESSSFPKVPKFTPGKRSAESEAQSLAAKEANRSKAWMKSSFSLFITNLIL